MKPIKILMAHEFYREPGGEDRSFADEVAILRAHGHEVITFTRSNADIDARGALDKARLVDQTIWSDKSYAEIVGLIREHKPQIVHFQNTFPLISPSAYYACRSEGVPVVQTLRNYRLICPNGLLSRDGRICRDCVGKGLAWPGIMHACYRGSRAESATVAAMVAYHRVKGTWASQVDAYIALTESGRAEFIEGGIPAKKISVKPNYVDDPGTGSARGERVVFVGRLSEEKGVRVLLDAWRALQGIPLTIVGDGPLRDLVSQCIEGGRISAQLLGPLTHAEALKVIRDSAFVLFPSLCFESFGRTIIEAYAYGKPVIGSRSGTALELIRDGQTGLHFEAGSAQELARTTRWLWDHPENLREMGKRAREEYEEKYTPERNYALLSSIYSAVRAGRVT